MAEAAMDSARVRSVELGVDDRRVLGAGESQSTETVDLSLASDPGIPVPDALGDYVWVIFRLANEPYSILLNSSSGNSEVLVGFVRRGS